MKFSAAYQDIKETIWTINAEEAAKMLAVYLYHKGELCLYEKANQAKVITVESPVVKASFNCWYFQSQENVEIVAECIFVKTVSICKLCNYYSTMLQIYQSIKPTCKNLVI